MFHHDAPSGLAREARPGLRDCREVHRNLTLGVVPAALFMAAADQAIAATALPAIQHELHARINLAGARDEQRDPAATEAPHGAPAG